MRMIRQHTVEKKNPKNNQLWEWEETPELIAAIKQLKASSDAVEALKYNPKRINAGNTNYAPLKGKK